MLAAVAAALTLAALGLYAFARHMQRRDPYAAFLRLKTRQKIAFFKRVLSDRRVPWTAKIIPILVVLYLLNPIDLIPDFLPVVGYLDDVAIVLLALALVLRLTPGATIRDLLRDVEQEGER